MTLRGLRLSLLIGLALLLLPVATLAGTPAQLQQIDLENLPIENISKSYGGGGSISADGRFVALSTVSALVTGDINDHGDVYVYDRATGELEFLGVPDVDPTLHHVASAPTISADGRYVSFRSDSPYYVPDDNNEASDAFVYDRNDGSFTRISLAQDGSEADADVTDVVMSADGRVVAFRTSAALIAGDTNGAEDIYLFDRENETLELATHGNGDAGSLSLSADGRFLAFASAASDLVEDDDNQVADIFVLDRADGTLERVSLASDGAEADETSFGPNISADGRFVVFTSTARTLIPGGRFGWHIYLRDRQTGVTEQIDIAADGAPADDESMSAVISNDGNLVAFSSEAQLTPDDVNAVSDTFLRDRAAGTTTLVSRSVFGVSGNGSSQPSAMTPDGRYIVFSSTATNMVYFDDVAVDMFNVGPPDVFVRDMQAAYPPTPFESVHARTDLPVAGGQAQRTWTWAPEPLTGAFYEPYGEQYDTNVLPYENRMVQYYDKSRMEITQHGEDPNSVWYVTNGLLVVEMMTGELQVSDASHLTLSSAAINVAGDVDDPDGPTYAGLAGLRDAPPHPSGQPITARVDRDGNVTSDETLASFGVQVAVVDDVTGHGIAAPFWDFMNSSGTIWDGNAFVQDQLFENAYFATGRPLIEAYWAEVLVGGQPRDVLMQCFERRCLTYTPGNPEGFIVEAGNVGLHYYSWRYGGQPLGPESPGAMVVTDGQHLTVVDQSGVYEVLEAPERSEFSSPVWSPDGSEIAYILWENFARADLYIVNADGTNVRELTFGDDASSPSWSPAGDRLVFESDGNIAIINADGTNRTDVGPGREPAWSPTDENRIAFLEYEGNGEWLKTMDPSGGNVVDIIYGPSNGSLNANLFSGYRWSPDGTQFAYAGEARRGSTNPEPLYHLFVVDAGGTNNHEIESGGSEGYSPGWSPDGSRLTYVRDHVLYAVNLDGSGVRGLAWEFDTTIRDYDWTGSN